MSTRYVVIMAGGSGTRFWPRSRRARPKQFLTIGGETSLLRQSVDRVIGLVDWDHLLIVTARVHAEHVQHELPELPIENVLVEPVGRNTAPCIGWATKTILERDRDARIAVLPADHFIADTPAFVDHLETALDAATDHIVLLGLVPTRPETGYGYIKQGEEHTRVEGRVIHHVERFVEKPDRPTAERYLTEGGYLWNSGMFVFPATTMETAIGTHMPELAEGLSALMQETERLDEIYPTLPSVSIDYGVMEKADDVLVLPSSFPWSDVGSWDAAKDAYAADADGNVVLGDAMLIETQSTLVDARAGRFVALVDVEDLLVIDTKDALLVTRQGRSQDVKKVVEALVEQGREELL